MPTIELTDDQAAQLEHVLQAHGETELLTLVVAARQRAAGLVRGVTGPGAARTRVEAQKLGPHLS